MAPDQLTTLAQSTYYIEAPFAPWLWPLLEVCGIGLQIAGAWLKNKPLLLAGLGIALTGAFMERDLTLLAGDCIACLGLWHCLSRH